RPLRHRRPRRRRRRPQARVSRRWRPHRRRRSRRRPAPPRRRRPRAHRLGAPLRRRQRPNPEKAEGRGRAHGTSSLRWPRLEVGVMRRPWMLAVVLLPALVVSTSASAAGRQVPLPAFATARTFDGSDNNPYEPTLGEAGTPYARVAPENYADGIS